MILERLVLKRVNIFGTVPMVDVIPVVIALVDVLPVHQ